MAMNIVNGLVQPASRSGRSGQVWPYGGVHCKDIHGKQKHATKWESVQALETRTKWRV